MKQLFCIALMMFAFGFSQSSGQDLKRGWAGSDASQANAANARWSYNWGFEPQPGLHSEYVPMFWGRFGIQTRINAILGYDNVNYVLGFNEPERADQANMSVAEAIGIWTQICEGLEGSGIKLVSPAVSDTVAGRAWLDAFMQQVEADNLVVDEVAFHWYGFVNPANPVSSANSFLNKVDQYHNNYGRNVWVTEFAGLDFAGDFTDEEMQVANSIFMSVAIPGLESRPYVTRYSMWAFNGDSQPLVQNGQGYWNPTIVGDNYIPSLFAGDVLTLNENSVATDTAYLRGGTVNSDETVSGPSLFRIAALQDADGLGTTNFVGGEFNWEMSNGGDITIEPNSVLQKFGFSEVTAGNIRVHNDGLLELEQGVLWLHGPETQTIGDGQLKLNPQSVLRLGDSEDVNGFVFAYPIQCFGGVLQCNGDDVVLTSAATIFAQTLFDVAGSLLVNGSLLKPAATPGSGIVKQGPGELRLTGDSTFSGLTIMNDGLLALNGTVESDLLVNNGIVRGVGTVNGVTDVHGILRPGFNVGSFTTDFCEFFPGSALEIDLAVGGVNDILNVSGPLVLNEDVTLRLNLLGGWTPEIGQSFNIVDALVTAGQFDHLDLPALEHGEWSFDLFDSFGIITVVESDLIVGDVNGDGMINLLDVTPFVELLTSGDFQVEADVNGDGAINLLDVAPFIDLLAG